MGLFADRIFPYCCDKVMTDRLMQRERRDCVGRAAGTVLEIGIGTGLNLPYYDAQKVARVVGIEPAPGMLRRAERRVAEVPFPVELRRAGAEAMPVDNASPDFSPEVCRWYLRGLVYSV